MTTTHHTRRDAKEQARLEAFLTDLCEKRITFNELLGVRVESMAPPARLKVAMRPALIGHRQSGRLHGGVTSALLDTAGGFALMVAIADRHPHDSIEQVMQRISKLGTIDLRIDYLLPGLGSYFVASGEVLRMGGRVGTTQMRLVNDAGTLVATGTAAYILS
jgi:uncharacterized protein (TIGR00369 family)